MELEIQNIPSQWHSKDLRNFFYDAVESDGGVFEVFHFLHRSSGTQEGRCWCPVRVKRERVSLFLRQHHQRCWDPDDANDLGYCIIRHGIRSVNSGVSGVSAGTNETFRFLTNKEKRQQRSSGNQNGFEEFRPPSALPQGNVGTPANVIRSAVSQCKLSSVFLSRLGLASDHRSGGDEKRTRGSIERRLLRNREAKTGIRRNGHGDDDDDWEAWDTVETPDSPRWGRTREGREQLYEDIEEVTWEKGGSGLVFYTDDFKRVADTDKDEMLMINDPELGRFFDADTDGGVAVRPVKQRRCAQRGRRRTVSQPSAASGTRSLILAAGQPFHSEFSERYLKKFGWHGHGTSLSNGGIVDPLPIVVRPENQGLGYM